MACVGNVRSCMAVKHLVSEATLIPQPADVTLYLEVNQAGSILPRPQCRAGNHKVCIREDCSSAIPKRIPSFQPLVFNVPGLVYSAALPSSILISQCYVKRIAALLASTRTRKIGIPIRSAHAATRRLAQHSSRFANLQSVPREPRLCVRDTISNP